MSTEWFLSAPYRGGEVEIDDPDGLGPFRVRVRDRDGYTTFATIDGDDLEAVKAAALRLADDFLEDKKPTSEDSAEHVFYAAAAATFIAAGGPPEFAARGLEALGVPRSVWPRRFWCKGTGQVRYSVRPLGERTVPEREPCPGCPECNGAGQ